MSNRIQNSNPISDSKHTLCQTPKKHQTRVYNCNVPKNCHPYKNNAAAYQKVQDGIADNNLLSQHNEPVF